MPERHVCWSDPDCILYGTPGAARLFKEFAKANANFEVKAAAFEGELIPAAQIDRLATLPTLEEALARLMSTMKEAAAGKLVRTWLLFATRKKRLKARFFSSYLLTYKLLLILRNNCHVYH